jgi:glycosyltransferase involved in cell wall biosynthesis
MQVSVIIPTYNRCSFLFETLQSVRNQTLTDWECIIVDDGSNDDTEVQIKKLTQSDKRFKYLKRPDNYLKGANSCRNYGFEKSTGKYIQWLDDDDLLSENKLELQVLRLENLDNSKIFTTCDWDSWWPNKIFEKKSLLHYNECILPENFLNKLVRKQTFLPLHSYLTPKSLILISGPWNINLTLNDDAEYFNRVLLNSDQLISTEGCYVLYRDYQGLRISSKGDVESFILSLRLMHAYSKFNNISSKSYFKWKLSNIFHKNWKSNTKILKKHRFFFKENGINLFWANYYILKYSVFIIFYPWYKKSKKLLNS